MHLTFINRFLAAVTAVGLIYCLGGSYHPVQAETPAVTENGEVVLNLPLYGQVDYSDLVAEAEALANDAISRLFNQDSNLSATQVVVLGDRNGEMIPVLTATVSREQWQANPQVSAWSQYYASYGLIQRHGDGQSVAIAPTPSVSNRATPSQGRSFQIDEALDEGRLSGQAAQDYLSDLD